MKVYQSLTEIQQTDKGCVVAIGNFDGVHRGHQALIDAAHSIARKKKKPLAVLTFEPHPRQLFQPDQPPARLTPFAVKKARLEAHGVNLMVSLPFDWDFASQSADEFVESILKDGLGAAHVVIGYDFRFGQLRKGDADTLRNHDLPVNRVEAVKDAENIISSSRIRQLIRNGDIANANKLLGWNWIIQGTIFRGDRRGHELGYPTANILLNTTIHPAYGVYACTVRLEGEESWHKAATNIGIRPMFEVKEGQVEAHILDFPDIDLYGQTLEVKPIKRLRGEAKFDSLDALIKQMDKDCQETRTLLD